MTVLFRDFWDLLEGPASVSNQDWFSFGFPRGIFREGSDEGGGPIFTDLPPSNKKLFFLFYFSDELGETSL